MTVNQTDQEEEKEFQGSLKLFMDQDWAKQQRQDSAICTASDIINGKKVRVADLTREEKRFFWQRKKLKMEDDVLYRVPQENTQLGLPL